MAGGDLSPFAGIILCRLSGIISASFVILSLAVYRKRSTPEIQTVKRAVETQR